MIASRGIVRVFVGVIATSSALAGCMRLPIGGPRVESLHGHVVTDASVDDSAQIFSMNSGTVRRALSRVVRTASIRHGHRTGN